MSIEGGGGAYLKVPMRYLRNQAGMGCKTQYLKFISNLVYCPFICWPLS
jgi:hypothetical protein